MSEMVVKVSSAMLNAADLWAIENNKPWNETPMLIMARAAIKAMREPTEAMLTPTGNMVSGFAGEYDDHNVYYTESQATELWEAMIDAALDA